MGDRSLPAAAEEQLILRGRVNDSLIGIIIGVWWLWLRKEWE